MVSLKNGSEIEKQRGWIQLVHSKQIHSLYTPEPTHTSGGSKRVSGTLRTKRSEISRQAFEDKMQLTKFFLLVFAKLLHEMIGLITSRNLNEKEQILGTI